MVNSTMSWLDLDVWPDPWSLVTQNGHCDLARALGMLYTVFMCERDDVEDLQLIETEHANLVQINHGKYILNWSPGSIVNILSPELVIKQTVSSEALKRYIR